MDEVARRLEEALGARDRRDWATTYAVLSELRADDELTTDHLYVLGDAAWWLGQVRETIEICEECHERFLREGRVDRAALAALEGGFNWMLRGEPEIASGWLSRARHLLDGQPTGLGHGYLLWMDSQARLGAGDPEGAVAGARELRRLATELEQPVLGCFGLALEGVVAVRSGELDRGLGLLDEAMLPVLAGRLPPGESGNLYCQMISVCMDLADVERARHWTEVTQRWCDSFSDAVMFHGICRVHRAQLLRLEGDWERAVSSAREAGAALAELNREAVAEAHYEIAETQRLCGRLTEAREEYDAARRLGRVPEPGYSLLLFAAGRVDEADASIRRAVAEEADPFRRARLLAAQVEVACARGDRRTAETAATDLAGIAAAYPSPGFRAWAGTATARVLIGGGDPAAAVGPLREAIATYAAMRAGVEEATARALLGDALRGMGEPVAAAPELAAARDGFRALGLDLPAESPAPGTDPSAAAPPGGLTGREHEILRAVAEGLSNREVADRLVISEKTVARHLANVFAKLDVGSRTAAVAWLHRQPQ